jgi:hypothetical protein
MQAPAGSDDRVRVIVAIDSRDFIGTLRRLEEMGLKLHRRMSGVSAVSVFIERARLKELENTKGVVRLQKMKK